MAGTCKLHCQACNCSCRNSGAQNHPKCPQCTICNPKDNHTRKASY